MTKSTSKEIFSSPSSTEKSKPDSITSGDSKTSKMGFMPNLQDDLVDACLNGDPDRVAVLIKKGAKPNIKNSKGWYPLPTAVYGMSIAAVQKLLEETKGIPPMTWEQCEEHNKKHFGNDVFVGEKFNPIDLSKPTLGFAWYNHLINRKWSKVVEHYHLEVISESNLFSQSPVGSLRTLTGRVEEFIQLPMADVIRINLPGVCAAIEKRYADCRARIETIVKSAHEQTEQNTHVLGKT